MQKPNDREQRSQRGPAAPFGSFARQSGKIWRKGYLDFGSRQSLADSGRSAALMHGSPEPRSLSVLSNFHRGEHA